MALPTIVFHSTGSDTLASGAGPSTALTGTLAATHANTTVNITDAVNLAGVAVDGSAVLWLSPTSGRQFARITAVSGTSGNWTVTVADNYALTESGRSWAIGGKRLTLAASLQLGTDCRAGWTIDLQNNQVLTSNFNLRPNAVAGVFTTLTSTNTVRAQVSTATDNVFGVDLQAANALVISHLSFLCTASTRGSGVGPASNTAANQVLVSDCVFDGWSTGIRDHDFGENVDVNGMVIESCEVKNSTSHALDLWAGTNMSGCHVHDNAGCNLLLRATRTRTITIFSSIFDASGNDSVSLSPAANTNIVLRNCTISNNTVSGKSGLVVNTTAGAVPVVIDNCIFWTNRTGITFQGGNANPTVMRNNAFGGSVVADVAGGTTGTNPVTLTTSPFVSSTDFALNSAGGGGVSCRGAGATVLNASASATAPDIGAVQTGGTALPPLGRVVNSQNIGTY